MIGNLCKLATVLFILFRTNLLIEVLLIQINVINRTAVFIIMVCVKEQISYIKYQSS